jgi:hypothetical protein
MTLLIDECARICGCKPKALRDHLNHPMKRARVLKELVGKKVRTTYKDRNGFNRTFFFDELSVKGADSLPAYGRLAHPYNVCIAGHFYARHRIRLEFPYLPCAIVQEAAEMRYYPLELLEIVHEHAQDLDGVAGWLTPHFKEIKLIQSESSSSSSSSSDTVMTDADSTFDFSRACCSQKEW